MGCGMRWGFVQNHTVILNWNDSMVPLLRQMATASTELQGKSTTKSPFKNIVRLDGSNFEHQPDCRNRILNCKTWSLDNPVQRSAHLPMAHI